MPKPDMSLAVNVQVTGTIDNAGNLSASATYSQGATTPPSTGVVNIQNGNIDLNSMSDPNNDYSNKTDITFMLSGTVTDHQGLACSVNFPTDTPAVIINEGNGNGQLTPSLTSNGGLLIQDIDDNGQTYKYCLVVQADDLTIHPTAQLDPQIVNR